MTGAHDAQGAATWLASAAPEPDACRWEWERHPLGVALLPAGRKWDVLIVPGPLGPATCEVLGRGAGRPGPVLISHGQDPAGQGARTGFFVPAGTASGWLGRGVRGAGPGSWIVVPHPTCTAGTVHWLVPPDGSGRLTDPHVLELALHEAVTLLAGRESG